MNDKLSNLYKKAEYRSTHGGPYTWVNSTTGNLVDDDGIVCDSEFNEEFPEFNRHINNIIQTKYYKYIFNSKVMDFELIEIPLNKENWWYVQLDASIRFAFIKYVGLLPETVIIEPLSHYTTIKIIRPNFNNLEEVKTWLQKKIMVLDELNQQAKSNSDEDSIIYNFEIL